MIFRRGMYRGLTLKGEWVYGYLSSSNVITTLNEIDDNEYCEIVRPETVGQYICDRPNTSIYVDNSFPLFEGDLISNIKYGDGKIYTVYNLRWDEQECCFHGLGNRGDKYGLYMMRLNRKALKEYKCIGNIHQQPELFNIEEKYKFD